MARKSRGWKSQLEKARRQALMDTLTEIARLQGQLQSLIGKAKVDELAAAVEDGQMDPWERESFWRNALHQFRSAARG
jgi:hypothetical protein